MAAGMSAKQEDAITRREWRKSLKRMQAQGNAEGVAYFKGLLDGSIVEPVFVTTFARPLPLVRNPRTGELQRLAGHASTPRQTWLRRHGIA